MKKTEILFAGGIYLFRGLPSANSMEFENEAEVKLHLELFDKYMRKYVKIIEHRLTKDGWEYVVRIKDKRTLQKHIFLDSKAKDKHTWDVSRIIGERIRIFRLLLRRRLNNLQGRKGSGVGRVYEKFYFKSSQEAISYIEQMRANKIDLSQPEERYKPNELHYDEDGSIFWSEQYGISILGSESFRKLGKKWMLMIHKIWLKGLNFKVNWDYIVNKIIPYTNSRHFVILKHKIT